MLWIRILLFGLATFLTMQPLAVAFTGLGGSTSLFLPVDEAFKLQVDVIGGEVRAHWQIAPGYYFYRDRLSLEATDDRVSLAPPSFRTVSKPKVDPTFVLQQVFYDQAELTATI